ncbi:MAG: hypothetical protein K0Q90_3735 [Paenibacillaceae bacterium]|jgi:beta-lactamase regulating signal transducer with metallopeptidase domain|nr:hypothetical protein [Paenibacillaceae bacterium]
MPAFLATLLGCSAVMSVLSICYLAVSPYLSKRYSAKWMYYIWLIVIMGWIFPFWPQLQHHILPVQMPELPVIQTNYFAMDENPVAGTINSASSIPLWWIIGGVWGICAVGILAYNTWRHKRFLHLVNRWGEAVTDREALLLLESIRTDMNISKQVRLMSCSFITSPMMVGFFRPVILMPSVPMDSDELAFVLRHELIHYKQHDLWFKSLVLLTTAVHWFNPLVYVIAKTIEVQCEMSCDERLVRETSLEQRQRYSETIIGLIKRGTRVQTSLSTNFYREGNSVRTRIFRIMDNTPKKAGISVLCVALAAIMGARIVFAFSPANNEIALAAGKQEALQNPKHKQVINVDVLSLESRAMAALDGMHSLQAGDTVRYDIGTETDSQDFTVKLMRQEYINHELKDIWLAVPKTGIEITEEQSGSYSLFIYNKQEKPLHGIKGTIKIIR